jgi:hypothetical protein
MNRSCLFLFVPGLIAVLCVAFVMAATPSAACVYQDPPPEDPGAEEAAPPEDEPMMDEPPFDEPPGRGRGRHHPGMRGEGPGFGRDGDHPGRGRGYEGRGRRSDEMIEQFLEIIREKLPEHYERLEQLRKDDPRRFGQVTRRLRPVVREYLDLVEEDPELANTIFQDFRIDARLRDLSEAYRDASEKKDAARVEETEQEIRRLVRLQAEMSIARREARLRIAEKRLNEQLERLRRHRAHFEEERLRLDEFINERVEDVMQGRPPRDKPPHGRGGFGPAGRDGRGPRDVDERRDERRRDRRGGRTRERQETSTPPQAEPDPQADPMPSAGG